jgi:hypothetical protein
LNFFNWLIVHLFRMKCDGIENKVGKEGDKYKNEKRKTAL